MFRVVTPPIIKITYNCTVYYISVKALHVSGGNSTHHQEHTTVPFIIFL